MSSFSKEFMHAFVDEMNKIATATRSLAAMGAGLSAANSLKMKSKDDESTGHKVNRVATNTALGGAAGAVAGHYGTKAVKSLSATAAHTAGDIAREKMRGSAWTALDPRPALKKILSRKK